MIRTKDCGCFVHTTDGIKFCPLHAAAGKLLEATKGLFGLVEQNILVRNIDHDHELDWVIKQLPLVAKLAQAQAAIAEAEPPLPDLEDWVKGATPTKAEPVKE